MISCFKNSHLSMRPRTPMAKMLSTLVRLYSSTMICGITPMIHRMPQGISCHAGLLENHWWYHGRHGWLPVKRMQRYPWNDKIQMWLPETNGWEWHAGDHTQQVLEPGLTSSAPALKVPNILKEMTCIVLSVSWQWQPACIFRKAKCLVSFTRHLKTLTWCYTTIL